MLDMHGGLTDVGLEYIREYGDNLQSLSLTLIGNSDAGLVKLSKGYPRLRMLKLSGCPFNKQAIASFVFNMPSLRYVCSNRESTDGGSSDRGSSDRESSDRESSDQGSSDGGSSDHESSDREISDCVRTYLALTRPKFQL
nr:leucine-rich repeat, cysteine-containing subtype [Tanacetum cinerariifolium]